MRRLPRILALSALLLVVSAHAALAQAVKRPDLRNTRSGTIAADLREGRITRPQAALYRVQRMFDTSKLPERYRSKKPLDRAVCGTPDVDFIQKNWGIISEEGRNLVPTYLRPRAPRSRMFLPKGAAAATADAAALDAAKTIQGNDPDAPPYQYTHATANFLIHYSTTGTHAISSTADGNHNGIPDIIDRAGDYFETSRAWLQSHGYLLPPDDATHYYNVYFEAMDYLGYCYAIDWPTQSSRSFVSISCALQAGSTYDGTSYTADQQMRTTISHEYFHAVQNAYESTEGTWWKEACSMWIMDQVGPAWDAVNDYTGWVHSFLFYPENPLDDHYDGYQGYRDVLWAIFLQAHADPTGDVIREIWEGCVGPDDAIDANINWLDANFPGGFDEAWRQFLIANYKADYPEAAQFPIAYGNLWFEETVFTYPTGIVYPYWTPAGMGSNYLKFKPSGPAGYSLQATFNGADTPTWIGLLVGKDGSSYARTDTSSGVPGAIADFSADCDEGVLIVSPMLPHGFQWFDYTFSAMLVLGDGTPPSPNPMSFSAPPQASSSTSVSMTAVTAVDAGSPPVAYTFQEMTGKPGASSSGWQPGTAFTDAGLAVNTRYGYRVQARDGAPQANYTQWSSTAYAYTSCNTPGAPTLHDPSPTKLYVTLSDAGNPSNTSYCLYNQTSSQYVGAGGAPAGSPYWAVKSYWDATRITGLSPSTSYSLRVKAKNGDGVETAFSSAGAASTLAADTIPPVTSGLAIVPTLVKESITASVTITASASDLATGGSDLVAAEYYVGADPGQGAATAMTAADGAFNSPSESVLASLNTSTWTMAHGTYHLYVRARDEGGYWGAPAHLAIDVVDGVPPEAVSNLSASPAPPAVEASVSLSVAGASSAAPGYPASNAVDSNLSTAWTTLPEAESSSESILFDLAGDFIVGKVTLYPSGNTLLFPAAFKIKLSDGIDWWTVVSEVDYTPDPGANTWHVGGRRATQMQIDIIETPFDTVSGLYTAALGEVEVYSESGGSRAVNLTWTAPYDYGPTGRSAYYVVKHSSNPSTLATSFLGAEANETPPVPAAAGTGESMAATCLDPGLTYYFAVKSTDQYENVSPVSNVAAVTTLPDPNPYVALDGPLDESNLDVETAPTFSWHANRYNLFKIQFSNVPTFPTRPYRDGLKRLVKTIKFGVRRDRTSFTPSLGQWKAIKKLAASTDGTLYWRVEARARRDRALGVGYSEVFNEYGFDTGVFENLVTVPVHDKDGQDAMWPGISPQFAWTVTNPIYSAFYIDFAATPDINIRDRRNTYTVVSRNKSRTWLRPSTGQWTQIKKRFAGADGHIYWRVRGRDYDRAYSAVSPPALLIIDKPTFLMREPGPRHDGTVHPAEPFTLEWGISGEGYVYFAPQISLDDTFPRGRTTINRPRTPKFESTISLGLAKHISRMLDDAGTDTFFWRLVATDKRRAVSVESPVQSARVSETPEGGA